MHTHNLPWIEKYRPENLDKLFSHDEIKKTIQKFLESNSLPNLIFHGPAGCGKTSTALAIAKQLYTPKELPSMLLELNASDDRGIGIVREDISNFASTKTLFNSKFKFIILDEADAMTNDAQNALRRIIEKSIENVRFCIICNLLNGIIPAIQSRCTKFRFAPLNKKSVHKQLSDISIKENLKWTDSGIGSICQLSDGDMRKAINILQGTSMAHNEVTEEAVYHTTGYPTPQTIQIMIKSLLNDNFKNCYKISLEMKNEYGLAFHDLLKEIHESVLRMTFPDDILAKIIKHLSDLEIQSSKYPQETVHLAALIGIFQLIRHDCSLLAVH